MVYNKTIWVDRDDDKSDIYLINGVETEIKKDNSGLITSGTSVKALTMNKIEDGIKNVDVRLESLTNEYKKTVNNTENLTYTDGLLTNSVEYWTDGTTVKKDINISYTDGLLTSINTKLYDSNGVLQSETVETLNYDTNNNLISSEREVL